jgi:DNA-binding NtrC family response regulator
MISSAPPAAGAATILIVDDEPFVLNALKQTLERDGFHVVGCTSPIKALSILEERDFAVIISDQRMPEMMGLDFLIESRRLRPHCSRILITAVLALPTIVDAINKGEIFRFVAKPWLREELIATVRNAVQRHDLVTQNSVLQAETLELNTRLTEANASLEARRLALRPRADRRAKGDAARLPHPRRTAQRARACDVAQPSHLQPDPGRTGRCA